MSKELKVIKRFLSGGNEYRICEDDGGYVLDVWEEMDGYWETLYREESLEKILEKQLDVYESNVDFDMNL